MRTSKLGGSTHGQQQQQGADHWPYRHNSETIAKLEAKFKQCSYPNKTRWQQISEELEHDPEQNRNEQIHLNVLRGENKKMKSENCIMRETLQKVLCSDCASNAVGPKAREIETLKEENILIAKEGRFLNQMGGNLAPNTPNLNLLAPPQLNISTPTPHLFQDIPVDASALNKDIHAPTLDQGNPNVINSTIDKNISNLHPNIIEDEPLLISSLDYNIPALVTIIDQDIATLISTREKKIIICFRLIIKGQITM
ncbi:hypothetical protein VNO78_25899 [Psophocarpus tetragonolobus]|uniref:Homeobox domain-containing protein n=1 Tax=Psophocarpus tetragonolobus TaxID=3891 RepID=A0AAN9S879_PSOTE